MVTEGCIVSGEKEIGRNETSVQDKLVAPYHLHEIYGCLGVNAVLKGILGGGLGALLMFRCPVARRYCTFFGSGFGCGYATKEADVYLSQPFYENLPNLAHQMCHLKSVLWTKAKSFYKNLTSW